MRISSAVLVVSCVGILIGSVAAEIPQIISYQGKVTDTGGTQVPDGTYSMRFRIYDASSGGTLEWDSGTRSIGVSDGVFNVMLGESPQPVVELDFEEDYWLQVTFQSVNQLPRQRLSSVGYAYIASGLVPGTETRGSVTGVPLAAFKAVNTAVSGGNYGGWFESHSSGGRGLYATAQSITGSTYGVFATSESSVGTAVYGKASATTGLNYAISGRTYSTGGRAVYGLASASTGTNYGGYFKTNSEGGYGVYGASPGGTGVWGEDLATTGINFGVWGRTPSTSGRGVYGYASSVSGNSYGLYGRSESTSGTGVRGETYASSGNTYGVYAESWSLSGKGLYAWAPATTGTNYGVYAGSSSTAGTGVYGEAYATQGTNFGIHGKSASASGRGVYGHASSTWGYTHGVRGISHSTDGSGVSGWADATSGATFGVSGRTNSTAGTGVYGFAESNQGQTYGVDGVSWSNFGTGVRGRVTATTGTNYGVYGESASTDGRGVFGKATSNSGWNYGVYGQSQSTTFGYGVYSSGDFGASGSKSCVVKTSQGPTRLYCQESPEVWFEDFGESQLVGGRAHVELDPLFLETIVVDEDNPMKVFVQLRDECNGTYVSTGTFGFDVIELHSGASNARFTYRVVAKRVGFETERLEVDQAARTDSYLYPELGEKELPELESDRARLEDQHRRMEQEKSHLQEELAAVAQAEREREAEWGRRAKDAADMVEECAQMDRNRIQMMAKATDAEE